MFGMQLLIQPFYMLVLLISLFSTAKSLHTFRVSFFKSHLKKFIFYVYDLKKKSKSVV